MEGIRKEVPRGLGMCEFSSSEREENNLPFGSHVIGFPFILACLIFVYTRLVSELSTIQASQRRLPGGYFTNLKCSMMLNEFEEVNRRNELKGPKRA